jgi:hypothetical protein
MWGVAPRCSLELVRVHLGTLESKLRLEVVSWLRRNSTGHVNLPSVGSRGLGRRSCYFMICDGAAMRPGRLGLPRVTGACRVNTVCSLFWLALDHESCVQEILSGWERLYGLSSPLCASVGLAGSSPREGSGSPQSPRPQLGQPGQAWTAVRLTRAEYSRRLGWQLASGRTMGHRAPAWQHA